jgi:uncharacterized protein (DUF697 family)
MKKEMVRRWHLDTPVGVMGIIALLSGLALFVVIVQGIAKVIRGAIPWVAGSTVGAVYWSSIGFALKASFIFLIFCSSVIIFFLLKLYYHR